MVAQTSIFLQFHTTHISQTLGNTLTARYLNNSEPQVKLLSQIGRGTKRRRYRGCLLLVTGKTETPQQVNRQDTYLRDNKEQESNTEQENMCGKTKGNNIVGVE